MANLQGECLCGQVKLEITENVSKLHQSHCLQCQKQSDSLSNTTTIVGKKDFCWFPTRSCISSWIACGSLLPNSFNSIYYYGIPPALIENAQFDIVAGLFTSSKAPSDKSITFGTEYGTLPKIAQIFNLLHN